MVDSQIVSVECANFGPPTTNCQLWTVDCGLETSTNFAM